MDIEPMFQMSQSNDCNMKDLLEPNWILDRRDSGRFYWRRGSGNASLQDADKLKASSNRVKFLCDVEVLEFLKQDDADDEDDVCSSDDEDDFTRRLKSVSAKYDEDARISKFVGSVCFLCIVSFYALQWWYYR